MDFAETKMSFQNRHRAYCLERKPNHSVPTSIRKCCAMFCKMSVRLFAVAFLFLILVTNGEAQLNFSTGWGQGKRSQDVRIRSSNADCSSQGASLEQLLKLYSFIQVEAQRILDCQTLNK
ncbi:hypothetical protein PUN28_011465 [Cardiocondyla obscurior]|uniref:Adipokinetic hormone n=1 Tax=Cardiocondyla obscurior TaxID=286306 RepID=A0AAW2FJE3_9HYME